MYTGRKLKLKTRFTNLILRKRNATIINTNLVFRRRFYVSVFFFCFFFLLFIYFFHFYYYLFIKVTLGSSDRSTQPCVYFIYYNTVCTFFFSSATAVITFDTQRTLSSMFSNREPKTGMNRFAPRCAFQLRR